MKKRINGERPAQIAAERRVSIKAVYQMGFRATQKLTAEQRRRFAQALASQRGRRIKIRPMSLSFAPNE